MRHQHIGWDIGGANLKAVLLDTDGSVVKVHQLVSPLWLGLGQLKIAIHATLSVFEITPDQAHHAITMTGELVDLFESRHEGVVKISQLVTSLLGNEVLFYSMNASAAIDAFMTADQVTENTKMIASANWHASARLLSKYMPSALLIDIGSTTTDIILIDGGQVVDKGFTDASRMQQDTLVYTGVVRTPVMAVAQKLNLDTEETNVAAEYFATMADIYRLTEELPQEVDMAKTADGHAKTILASAKRLARMVGHDVEDKPIEVWHRLAYDCRAKQLNQIKTAVMKHIKADMIIVGAGAGAFLVKALAYELNHPYTCFSALLNNEFNEDVAVCLPAYAVAKLGYLRDVSLWAC